MFNSSVEYGIFPAKYKELTSVCVHKRDNKADKINYRQIVCIEPLAGAMEAIINQQLLKFLLDNELIPKYQYGFIKGNDVGTIACLKDDIG